MVYRKIKEWINHSVVNFQLDSDWDAVKDMVKLLYSYSENNSGLIYEQRWLGWKWYGRVTSASTPSSRFRHMLVVSSSTAVRLGHFRLRQGKRIQARFLSASLNDSTIPINMYGARSVVSWADRNLSLPLLRVGRWHGLFMSHGITVFARPSCK